jgi:tetratricopeptide (TPR) repeat protein
MVEDRDKVPQDGFTDLPPAAPDLSPPEVTPPAADPPAVVIAPVPVSLRSERGPQARRCRLVMAALTADALWLQDTWQLRLLPLSILAGVEMTRNGRGLTVTVRPEVADERLRLTFDDAAEARRWHGELLAQREQPPAETPAEPRRVPEGVALVTRAPGPSQVVVGQVEFTGRTSQTADRGLQLRAALRGADAVVGIGREKSTSGGQNHYHVSGIAIRVEDVAERLRLRRCWFADEVRSLVKRILLLLVCQVALLTLVNVFCAGETRFHEATGETPLQALQSSARGLGLLFGWPLLLLLLLRVLRRPELLPALSLAILTVTTGRGLTVIAAHLLAVRAAGAAADDWMSRVIFDPVDWAFIIIGLVLSVRAWRLAGDAADILPWDGPAVPVTRRAWSRGLVALSGLFALAMLGFVGVARYQASAYLAQPGIDPRREQEAGLALDQGVAFAKKGDLAEAERSYQSSLRLWEELTREPSAPAAYRRNLGQTLFNLAVLRHRQGRLDEAERYYARAVEVGNRLADDPAVDDDFKRTLADARRFLAELREDRLGKDLDEKDQRAVRKYEEATVQASKGAAGAGALYEEAIALWEEILPQATIAEYRRFALARLEDAYLSLGQWRFRQGQRRQGEAALRKAIDYGEKAVELAPDRALARHNLEVAREMLDGQAEQELQEEIDRLCTAERFGEVSDLFAQRVAESEKRLGSGKDRDAATRRLAERLDRFAWFLAHCPDEGVRDTKAAVKRARRATVLQPHEAGYWYTLAMVQYRDGAWRDSLVSLEEVKARSSEFGASEWLLIAMNRHRLKQRPEALAALRKAVEWIEERKRLAEDNPALRLQFERMRPAIESLRRETEKLLQGNDPANRGVG